MLIKLLSVILMIVVIIGLSGCGKVFEPEFPITITRVSDGVQISMGMYRDDIENTLEVMPEHDKFIQIIYSDNNIARGFNIRCFDWTFAGIFVGGDIQIIIDSGKFEDIYYYGMANPPDMLPPVSGTVGILLEYEESSTILNLFYDFDGKITGIDLFDMNF